MSFFSEHYRSHIAVASFTLALLTTPLYSNADIGASQSLETTIADKVIHVDQNNPKSSDSNAGNEAFPLKTVTAAAKLASENHKRGFAVKILLYPGVYREQIRMNFRKQKENPTIIFSAKDTGSVTISGSDIWTDWTKTNRDDIFVHTWPHQWGVRPYPPGWEGNATLEPIGRRRELVFLDKNQLRQVISFSDLAQGTFYVSEETEQIFIQTPHGIDPSTSTVEVGVRAGLFSIEGKTNFAVIGLRFEHDVSGIEGNALSIFGSTNVLVQDCTFVWNNWTGYRIHDSQNVTSRRNVANNNGGTGLTAWKVKSFLSEEDVTSYNNWRGKAGKLFYWAVSGTKIMRIHDAVFTKHRARGNHAAGFWLDYDNQNILLKENIWCGNLKHGLFIEVSQGPITLLNSAIYNNQEWGIRSIASRFIMLSENQIFNNAGQQIFLTGPAERMIDNWESKQKIPLTMENWTLTNNYISGNFRLLDTKDWAGFLKTLTSEGNAWHKPTSEGAFQIGTKPMTFSDWKSTSRQDSTSFFSNETKKEMTNLDCAYSS